MVSPLLNWFARVFNPILDPVFGFLLQLPPFWGIFVITLVVTMITTLVYKKMTDQEVLKSIKEEMKELRKQMKEFQHDAHKISELQKISMQKSMIQMKQTMKPMLITMIPILIIFGWFATHLAYYPILPGMEFSANLTFSSDVGGDIEIIVPEGIQVLNGDVQKVRDNRAGFTLKGIEGDYNLEFIFGNKSYTKDVLITKQRKYKDPEKFINEDVKTIKLSNEPVKVFGLTWFWSYFILAVILNSLLRKLLKVH